ncbi:hypothetical protein TNCV_1797871 [Trichonephila clavipes]|nr:hypothetical protein TNCV_1797871 [Trichonephila clavipes]
MLQRTGQKELIHVKSVKAQRPHVGMVSKFGKWVPAWVSSSSFDCDLKLQGKSILVLTYYRNNASIQDSSPSWQPRFRTCRMR